MGQKGSSQTDLSSEGHLSAEGYPPVVDMKNSKIFGMSPRVFSRLVDLGLFQIFPNDVSPRVFSRLFDKNAWAHRGRKGVWDISKFSQIKQPGKHAR